MTMAEGNILSDLNRAKVLFQQRAIMAVLDIPVSGGEALEGAINHPSLNDGPVNIISTHVSKIT